MADKIFLRIDQKELYSPRWWSVFELKSKRFLDRGRWSVVASFISNRLWQLAEIFLRIRLGQKDIRLAFRSTLPSIFIISQPEIWISAHTPLCFESTNPQQSLSSRHWFIIVSRFGLISFKTKAFFHYWHSFFLSQTSQVNLLALCALTLFCPIGHYWENSISNIEIKILTKSSLAPWIWKSL